MRSLACVIASCGFLFLSARVVSAQQHPLSQIVVNLAEKDLILAPPPPGQLSHETHFIPNDPVTAYEVPVFLNNVLVSQLATFPIGSSSGGFTYTYDPTVRSFKRSTNSFGPAFAERALTIGKGKVSVGANYQHSSYDSFEGQTLDNGSIKFYLKHADVPGNNFFEGDVIQESMRLTIKSDTFAMFANYGVSNRLDVGVAVPIVSVKLDAAMDAKILRLATAGINPPIHAFQNGTDSETFTDSGSASGIGDVLLRGKYRLYDTAGGGLAVALDLRLPTGDDQNLLGLGVTQAKLQFVGSTEAGRFSPHVNFGYSFTGSSSTAALANPSDEVNYTFGSEYAAMARLTVNADVVGRTLRGAGRLTADQQTFTFVNQAGVAGSTTLPAFSVNSDASLNLVVGAFGVKWNPTGNLLISANVLLPFTNAGLRAKLTPVIGVDYGF
jgi:hypothetical protein